MDINKWKSCAVDIETYAIIRAMGSRVQEDLAQ